MAGLGELLLHQGVVDEAAIAKAEAHRAESGSNLAQSLVALGLATEADLVRAFARSLELGFIDPSVDPIDEHAVGLLDAALARELVALPVGFGTGSEVEVAFADPKAREQLSVRLRQEMGVPVVLKLAPRQALVQAITTHTQEPVAVGAPAAAGSGAPLAEPAVPAPPAAVPEAPGQPAGDGAAAPPAPAVSALRDVSASTTDGPRLLSEEDSVLDLDDLLRTLVERKGSDLHLTTGVPPVIRFNGDLVQLDDHPRCTADDLQKLLYAIMTQKQREQFENELELDMSYSVPGLARFRVNIFQQRDAMGAVMRVIPFDILPLEELGIPERVADFAYLPRGFVLVTGPTGSGKTTTLASLIDLANRNRPAHIVTVEDPIEFLHRHKRAVINQREVGTDTHGFAAALKHVLRQDPDIILVGEMRDLETIQIALTAAETGHLVFGTLHTQDAPQSIDRMIDVFPPHQQEQIRVMLSGALKGVVAQSLIKTADGRGRTAACEVMVATSGIRNLIREGKTHQIYSAIQAGARDGMIAMDQSLAKLVRAGKITYDAALEKCNDVQEFNRLAGRG